MVKCLIRASASFAVQVLRNTVRKVYRDVLRFRETHEIIERIVVWIAINVVDVAAFRDWPVSRLPDFLMQRLIPLLAARVIAPPRAAVIRNPVEHCAIAHARILTLYRTVFT